MDSSDRTRRGMKEALQSGALTEEARCFVSGKAAPARERQVGVMLEDAATITPPDMRGTRTPEPPQAGECSAWNLPTDLSVVLPAIVSLSFRLPAGLAGRLARVSAERKLRRERPFTQQAIVVDALTRWLDRHAPKG